MPSLGAMGSLLARRAFLGMAGATIFAACRLSASPAPEKSPTTRETGGRDLSGEGRGAPVKLFLAGDVMTGRGVDQVLPHPGDPTLHEPVVSSALRYVELAEQENGPIPKPVDFAYPWGEALDELERRTPDVRIVNLETSVTTSDSWHPGKGIHYRMHPKNVGCLTAAGLDVCGLANNHVLDWGRPGLEETLGTLRRAGIRTAGAGTNLDEALAPAVVDLRSGGRVLVFSVGSTDSGIPSDWRATAERSGVLLIEDLSDRTLDTLAETIDDARRPGDLVVLSIHWGPNWGYDVPPRERRFAHALVETAGVDVVHGHSSHHPKGIEVHRDRPILYGAGDFINDYEGIGGHESYRSHLSVAYFAEHEAGTGRLLRLELVPFAMRRFSLFRPSEADVAWLERTLDRESAKVGTTIERIGDSHLAVRWS